ASGEHLEHLTAPLRLTIELVPATCWGVNLRDVLTRPAWDALRRQVYTAAGHRCALCGAGGQLHCHEGWRDDDTTHVQLLAGCLVLCVWWLHVRHLGHAALLAAEGRLRFQDVVAHFLRVNGCDHAAFARHQREAFALFEERSRHEWTTDFGFALHQE